MNLIAFLLQLLCWFFIAKKGIRQTEEGKEFINKLDSKTIDFLRWRSISDISLDLKKLGNFFGVIAISGIILNAILMSFKIEPGLFFLITILISLLCWMSLKWGTNKRKETLHWFKYLGLVVFSPWLFYTTDLLNNTTDKKILPIFGEILKSFYGFTISSSLDIAIVLTIISLVGMTLVTLFWFIQNTLILYTFILALWILNKTSKLLLKINEDKIIFLAYLLMPVCMIVMYFT